MTIYYYYGVKWPEDFKIQTRLVYSCLLAHSIHGEFSEEDNHEKDGSGDERELAEFIMDRGYADIRLDRGYLKRLTDKMSVSRKTIDRCLDFLFEHQYIVPNYDEDEFMLMIDHDFRPVGFMKLHTRSKLSGHELLVYSYLAYKGADFLRRDCYNNNCEFSSAEKISRVLGISKSTYDKSITGLKIKGFIERCCMRTSSGNILTYIQPHRDPVSDKYEVKRRVKKIAFTEPKEKEPINVPTQTYKPVHEPKKCQESVSYTQLVLF